MNRSVELLQVFRGAGLFRNAVEGGTERFGPLLFRNVAIKNIRGDAVPADDDGSAGDEDVDQRAIPALPLGLQRYLLSLVEDLANPTGFRVPVRRHDKRVNTPAQGFLGMKAEHACELAIDAHDSVLLIENADGFGSAFHQLLEVSSLHLEAVRSQRGCGTCGGGIGRLGKGRSPALERILEKLGAQKVSRLRRPGDLVTHLSPCSRDQSQWGC